MEFQPILILAIVWLLIGLPLSKLGKTAKQQAAKTAKPGAKPQQDPAQAVPQQPLSEPDRPRERQPTISVTEHDDSIYRGSLNAFTDEGYDPCHEEMLATITFAETEPAVPAAENAVPGLQLSWTGSDVVRGIVMSEILKRK